MKIAIVADPFFPIPPEKYGGTERVIYNLILGLIERGHQVTLFGAGDSKVPCRLVSCCPKHINNEMPEQSKQKINDAIQINETNIINHQNEFDIINWHAAPSPVLLSLSIPVVITHHIPYDHFIKVNSSWRRKVELLPHSSISLTYQKNFPVLNYVGNVYSGVDCLNFPFSPVMGEYLVFVGRFSLEKQPHLVILTAINNNLPLKLAGKVDGSSHQYFETQCKPYFSHNLVSYLGEVNESQRNSLLRDAMVNLHLIDVEETFGLTVLEAGLTGTPTIAFRRGSMSELIVDGVSGYLADNLNHVSKLIKEVGQLDRKEVRKHYEKFNLKTMAKNYEKIYQKIIATKAELG